MLFSDYLCRSLKIFYNVCIILSHVVSFRQSSRIYLPLLSVHGGFPVLPKSWPWSVRVFWTWLITQSRIHYWIVNVKDVNGMYNSKKTTKNIIIRNTVTVPNIAWNDHCRVKCRSWSISFGDKNYIFFSRLSFYFTSSKKLTHFFRSIKLLESLVRMGHFVWQWWK